MRNKIKKNALKTTCSGKKYKKGPPRLQGCIPSPTVTKALNRWCASSAKAGKLNWLEQASTVILKKSVRGWRGIEKRHLRGGGGGGRQRTIVFWRHLQQSEQIHRYTAVYFKGTMVSATRSTVITFANLTCNPSILACPNLGICSFRACIRFHCT